MNLPAQDSAEKGGVEAFGRRETALHFGHRYFVLGRRAEKRQATRHRTKDVVGRRGQNGDSDATVFVASELEAVVVVVVAADEIVVVHKKMSFIVLEATQAVCYSRRNSKQKPNTFAFTLRFQTTSRHENPFIRRDPKISQYH